MAESKITATDRLRKEGRWEEASLWRDGKRKQLRAEGNTKTEANEASWQAMVEAFPPLPAIPDESPNRPPHLYGPSHEIDSKPKMAVFSSRKAEKESPGIPASANKYG